MSKGEVLNVTIEEMFKKGIANVCETSNAYWIYLEEDAKQGGTAMYRVDKKTYEISMSMLMWYWEELGDEEEKDIPLDEFRELMKSSNSFSK